jgi:V8-like Glu-specific endopeptidase
MAVKSYGGGIVTHVYDGNVQYTTRAFQFHTEGGPGSLTYFTSPQPPKKPRPESVLMYDKNPQGLGLEKVLKQIVLGQDGRSRILNTRDSPYCIHAQLTPVFAGQECGGSGVMIGPHHVLTCGHNVYDFETKSWASSISVYPALNERSAPFGGLHVVKVYMFADWTNRGDTDFDIALLVLNRSVGKYTGWGGVMSTHNSALTNQRVHITGYPGDKNCIEMWTMEHTMDAILAETFKYRIDTYNGQSGSAIWFLQQGSPMIVGVHTSGTQIINGGTRISYQKFTEFVIRILGETRKISKAIPPRQIPLPVAANPAPKNVGGRFVGPHQAPPPAAVAMPLPPSPAPRAAIPVISPPEHPFVAALYSAIPGKPAGAPPGEEEYRKALATEHKFENWHAKFLLYKAAAEKGYPPAMGKLGDCYFGFGEGGVERNFPEAIRWYRQGIEEGDPHSEYRLGNCYIHGAGGVPINVDEGIRLMGSAIMKGHADTGGYLCHSPQYRHFFEAASHPAQAPSQSEP